MKHPTDQREAVEPVADGCVNSMFAVLDVARNVHERLEAALESVGLSIAKYMALEILVRAGEPLTLSELASQLRCVRSNITQLVDRLESDGLVRRVDDPTDRRAVRAVVTPLGARRQDAAANMMRKLESELAARVAPADRALFKRVLSALR